MEPCLILSTYQNAWPKDVVNVCLVNEYVNDSEGGVGLVLMRVAQVKILGRFLFKLLPVQRTGDGSFTWGLGKDELFGFHLSSIHSKFQKVAIVLAITQQVCRARRGRRVTKRKGLDRALSDLDSNSNFTPGFPGAW